MNTRHQGRKPDNKCDYWGPVFKTFKDKIWKKRNDKPITILLLLPSQERGGAPSQFSAHFYCGQTAGSIKMPLGTEPQPRQVCVRWDPAPSQKGGGAPSPILRVEVEVENFEIGPEVRGTSGYS